MRAFTLLQAAASLFIKTEWRWLSWLFRLRKFSIRLICAQGANPFLRLNRTISFYTAQRCPALCFARRWFIFPSLQGHLILPLFPRLNMSLRLRLRLRLSPLWKSLSLFSAKSANDIFVNKAIKQIINPLRGNKPRGALHKEECGLSFLSFARCTIKKICQYASIGRFLLMHHEQNQFVLAVWSRTQMVQSNRFPRELC